MSYALDDNQLLRIWTVVRYLGEIRNICNPTSRAELLTEAQILLTAFVLELTPLSRDQSQPPDPCRRGAIEFDLQ